jgi:hypothetical protein
MKRVITPCSPVFFHFRLRRSKYSSQHSGSKKSPAHIPNIGRGYNFHTHTKQQEKIWGSTFQCLRFKLVGRKRKASELKD